MGSGWQLRSAAKLTGLLEYLHIGFLGRKCLHCTKKVRTASRNGTCSLKIPCQIPPAAPWSFSCHVRGSKRTGCTYRVSRMRSSGFDWCKDHRVGLSGYKRRDQRGSRSRFHCLRLRGSMRVTPDNRWGEDNRAPRFCLPMCLV